MTNWTKVTQTQTSLEPDGIPFVLTQNEQSKVALYKGILEKNRRLQNEEDARQARAEALGNAARLGVVDYDLFGVKS